MHARMGLFAMFSMVGLACARPTDTPPPQEPVASVEAPEPEPSPEPEPEPEQADPLDDLGSGDAKAASRPEAIEVAVDAVITAKKDGAPVIMVGVEPRFTLHMKIEAVEPETPLLVPGHYDVLIHSPSKTFRGPVPAKGKRILFRMSIFPEDPSDPHDEVFFASLWVE